MVTSKNTTESSSKTPYEIRLAILQMAKDHLESTFRAQVDFSTKMMDALVETNNGNTAQLQSEMKKLIPVGFTIEDITKKAAELYSFVLTK